MTHFVKHGPCIKCGSSDAYATYSDGAGFCFSCRKLTKGTISGYAYQALHNNEDDETLQQQAVSLPSDASHHYSKGAVEWLQKYHVDVTTAIQNGLLYSQYRDQLIFPFYAEDTKTLLAYQARNLSATTKAKRYFTQGDINALLPIYYSSCINVSIGTTQSEETKRFLVLVEDCVSAIRLKGIGCSSMPLLGSGISRLKLTRLRPFYDVLEVWLDSNMWHKAQSIVKQAQMLGFKARAVYSTEDPKCYTNQELLDKLRKV